MLIYLRRIDITQSLNKQDYPNGRVFHLNISDYKQKKCQRFHQALWLKPVIPATQEVEIERIVL
jgi:hypothetical protein